ncbi:DUF1286 domain-containing protein [Sulfuracidifex tepidarius]|uniref:Uncharacterized protein n=1 Tax=Sulfuracidifex tepidarius TaxID=1294262 RepID=A0A510E1V7_9CREN|nr:hypothetical protein IC007_0984 [Sulfuracidifex tepidarius]
MYVYISLPYLMLAGVLSVAGNLIIDELGHREVRTRRWIIPTTTPQTHTFPRSVVWGMFFYTFLRSRFSPR